MTRICYAAEYRTQFRLASDDSSVMCNLFLFIGSKGMPSPPLHFDATESGNLLQCLKDYGRERHQRHPNPYGVPCVTYVFDILLRGGAGRDEHSRTWYFEEDQYEGESVVKLAINVLACVDWSAAADAVSKYVAGDGSNGEELVDRLADGYEPLQRPELLLLQEVIEIFETREEDAEEPEEPFSQEGLQYDVVSPPLDDEVARQLEKMDSRLTCFALRKALMQDASRVVRAALASGCGLLNGKQVQECRSYALETFRENACLIATLCGLSYAGLWFDRDLLEFYYHDVEAEYRNICRIASNHHVRRSDPMEAHVLIATQSESDMLELLLQQRENFGVSFAVLHDYVAVYQLRYVKGESGIPMFRDPEKRGTTKQSAKKLSAAFVCLEKDLPQEKRKRDDK